MSATMSQPLTALAKANEIRSRRAEVKRSLQATGDLAEARRVCSDLIEHPPPDLRGIPVCDLLMACHRQGRVMTLRSLRVVAIPERKPIGELTQRQRDELVGLLRRP